MANRPLARRQVTDVVIPQDRLAEGLDSLAGATEGLMELEKKKESANINSYLGEAQLQMLDATNKWRVANEGDPTNTEALEKLNTSYDTILNHYYDKVGFLSRGDWATLSNRLKNQYRLDNAEWGQKQTVVNIKNATNAGIENNQQMFRSLGRSFDYNKLKSSYQNSRQVLESSAINIIGETETGKLLDNYQRDAMRNFIWGAAETDPDKAELLLSQREVQNDIKSREDIDTLQAIIKKNKEIKKENILEAQNTAEDKILTDYLLDSSKVDIMTVNKALVAQQIRPEFANQMRKVLLSLKTVGAKSDPYLLDELYREFYSLQIDEFGSSKADIKQVMDFRNRVLDLSAEGRIGKGDFNFFQKGIGKALNQELDSPFGGRRSSGMTMKTVYEGISQAIKNKVPYNDLVPTTTALFKQLLNETEGQELSAEDIRVKTNQIISTYFRGKYPSVALKEELPNSIYSDSSGLNNISAEQPKQKPDLDIEGDKVKMISPEGKYYYIPKENVAKAEEKGLKHVR